MSDVRHIIARGKELTGRKLRQAIESATGTLIGGRGIRVSTVNGRSTVSLLGHVARPKPAPIPQFMALLSDFVEIEPNRWEYDWVEVIYDAETAGFATKDDGQTSGDEGSGPALNIAEWTNTINRAFHGVDLDAVNGDVTVLPITEQSDTPILMTRMSQLNPLDIVPPKKKGDPALPISGLFWFYAMNGASIECPKPDPPPQESFGRAGLLT